MGSRDNYLAPEGPGSYGWEEYQAELRGEDFDDDRDDYRDHEDDRDPTVVEAIRKRGAGPIPSGQTLRDVTEEYLHMEGYIIGTQSVCGNVDLPEGSYQRTRRGNLPPSFYCDKMVTSIAGPRQADCGETVQIVTAGLNARGEGRALVAGDVVAYSVSPARDVDLLKTDGRESVVIFPASRALAEAIHAVAALAALEGKSWDQIAGAVKKQAKALGVAFETTFD